MLNYFYLGKVLRIPDVSISLFPAKIINSVQSCGSAPILTFVAYFINEIRPVTRCARLLNNGTFIFIIMRSSVTQSRLPQRETVRGALV